MTRPLLLFHKFHSSFSHFWRGKQELPLAPVGRSIWQNIHLNLNIVSRSSGTIGIIVTLDRSLAVWSSGIRRGPFQTGTWMVKNGTDSGLDGTTDWLPTWVLNVGSRLKPSNWTNKGVVKELSVAVTKLLSFVTTKVLVYLHSQMGSRWKTD